MIWAGASRGALFDAYQSYATSCGVDVRKCAPACLQGQQQQQHLQTAHKSLTSARKAISTLSQSVELGVQLQLG